MKPFYSNEKKIKLEETLKTNAYELTRNRLKHTKNESKSY